MNNTTMTGSCNPYGLLACKIVERAVLDWRAAARYKSDSARFRMDEIRTFFRGKWCAELLSFSDMDGEEILARLERETVKLKNKAARGERAVTIDGRTAPIGTWCRELGVCATHIYKLYKEHGCECAEKKLAAIKREKGL